MISYYCPHCGELLPVGERNASTAFVCCSLCGRDARFPDAGFEPNDLPAFLVPPLATPTKPQVWVSYPSNVQVEYSEEWVEIPALRFSGQAKRSGNREWIVAWTQGLVVLLHRRQIAWEARARNPSEALVTSSGVVAFVNCYGGGFDTAEDCASLFAVLDGTGKQLLYRRWGGWIGAMGLTRNGTMAWCSTCAQAESGDDGGKLFVFDLSTGKTVAIADCPPAFGPQSAIGSIKITRDRVLLSSGGGYYYLVGDEEDDEGDD